MLSQVNPNQFSKGVTDYYEGWRRGDQEARNKLFTLIYQEIHRKAHFEKKRFGVQSLKTTDIAHETIAKVLASKAKPRDRDKIISFICTTMRHILITRYHKNRPEVNGARIQFLADDDLQDMPGDEGAERNLINLINLNQALEELDPKLRAIAEMKIMMKSNAQEIAETLGMARSTVDTYWPKIKRDLARIMLQKNHALS